MAGIDIDLSKMEIKRRIALGISLYDDSLVDIGRRSPRKQKPLLVEVADGTEGGKPKRHRQCFGGALPDWRQIATGPSGGRPVGPGGAITFHFKYQSISAGTASSCAGTHEKYIAREPAVEGWEREIGIQGDDQIARDEASEQAVNEACSVAPVSAIWSNISPLAKRRNSYWVSVEQAARVASLDGNMRIHVDRLGPDTITAELIASAPAYVQPSLESVRQVMVEAAANSATTLIEPLVVLMPPAEFEASNAWVKTAFGTMRKGRPITVNPPRSGIVQHRLVGELPHDIGSEGRVRVLYALLAELHSMGFMYTAAIHAPDSNNHASNFHFHVVFHDQPATWLESEKCWDFAFKVWNKRHGRFTHPLARNKSRYATGVVLGDENRSGPRFIGHLREMLADLVNGELAHIDSPLRYDPRSNSDIGIDRIPSRHLGSKQAALEAAGVATETGAYNAAVYWINAFRAENFKRTLDLRAVDARKAAMVNELRQRRLFSSDLPVRRIAATLSAYCASAQALIHAKSDLSLLCIAAERARSRPARAIETVGRLLERIAAGTASSTDSKAKPRIEARLQEALVALTEIDSMIAQGDSIMNTQRKRVELLEKQSAIDEICLVEAMQDLRMGRGGFPGEVFDRIARERIQIVKQTRNGRAFFAVPQLDGTDAGAIVRSQSASESRRLQGMLRRQRLEIDRLCHWVAAHSKLADLLLADTPHLNTAVMPKAIAKLARYWGEHPTVHEQCRLIALDLKRQFKVAEGAVGAQTPHGPNLSAPSFKPSVRSLTPSVRRVEPIDAILPVAASIASVASRVLNVPPTPGVQTRLPSATAKTVSLPTAGLLANEILSETGAAAANVPVSAKPVPLAAALTAPASSDAAAPTRLAQASPAAPDRVSVKAQSMASEILSAVPSKAPTLATATMQTASAGNIAHSTHRVDAGERSVPVVVSRKASSPASEASDIVTQSLVAQPAKPRAIREAPPVSSSTQQPSQIEPSFDSLIAAARTDRREVTRGKLHNETSLERAALEAGSELAAKRMSVLELEQIREFKPVQDYIATMTRERPPVLATEKSNGAKDPIKKAGRFQLDENAFEAAPIRVRLALANWRDSSMLANALSQWVHTQVELRNHRAKSVSNRSSELEVVHVYKAKADGKIELPVTERVQAPAPEPDWWERLAVQNSVLKQKAVAANRQTDREENTSDIDLYNLELMARRNRALGR